MQPRNAKMRCTVYEATCFVRKKLSKRKRGEQIHHKDN